MAGSRVLDEFEASGLDLRSLPGNAAKLRLILDLAARVRESERLRVLDVGCAGPEPLNLWEPFVPFFDRLQLVGVDVRGLDRVEARARELGLTMEVRQGTALALDGEYDAVVSTQVLEHLPDWRAGLAQMARVLRPGGTLYVTCDSGDLRRALAARARLVAKRAYARLPVKPLPVSGEWERGPRLEELGDAARSVGLELERLDRYALHDVKTAQRHAGSTTRQLWLALEETLAAETRGRLDPGLYGILYLRARRP